MSGGMDHRVLTAVTAVGIISAGSGFMRSTGRNTSIGKEEVRMRIRTIKPQLFTDADLSSMGLFTRYLFVGLFCYCDDNGVGLDDEALICTQLFPHDFYEHPNEVRQQVHNALLQLSGKLPEDSGKLRKVFLERYWDGKHHVFYLVNWDKHQKISHPAKSEFLRPEEVQENVEIPRDGGLFPNDSGKLPEDSGKLPSGIRNKEGNKEGITSSSEIADAKSDEENPDAVALCDHLRQRIIDNGSKPPKVTKRWLTEARLLIETDRRPLQQAHALIDWCQQDSFWSPNIQSMPKFREKYDTLRLKAEQRGGQNPAEKKFDRNLDVVKQIYRRDHPDSRQLQLGGAR
ncbi:MAG: hypothetical protein ABF747_02380 [Bifidobacterium sp.]|uniref:hypothetical protein n=1 Tax=Bifidobacterium sp. TaxID=41200 RepID=UPI0039EBABCC